MSTDHDADIKRFVERNLAGAEKAWTKARVGEAVMDAIEFCEIWQVPPPKWAVRALREIVPASLPYSRDMRDYRRYAAVVHAWQQGKASCAVAPSLQAAGFPHCRYRPSACCTPAWKY